MVHYVFYCFLHICDFLLLKHFLSDVLHGAKRRTTKEKSKQREFAHYECPCYKADGGGGQRGFLFGSLGERLVNQGQRELGYLECGTLWVPSFYVIFSCFLTIFSSYLSLIKFLVLVSKKHHIKQYQWNPTGTKQKSHRNIIELPQTFSRHLMEIPQNSQRNPLNISQKYHRNPV